MRTLSDLQAEAENHFRQLELDRSTVESAYQRILSTIDQALKNQDYASLFRLISYIEDGSGYPAFRHIGKTRRFLRILHIIELEYKHAKVPFCSGCNSVHALWEKYMLTLFAFRRLRFQLSAQSVEEAVSYLRSHPISPFAAYIIAENDLFIPDGDFYEALALIYTQEWTPADKEQFSAMTDPA